MMLFVQLDRIETVVKASGHHRLSRMIKLQRSDRGGPDGVPR